MISISHFNNQRCKLLYLLLAAMLLTTKTALRAQQRSLAFYMTTAEKNSPLLKDLGNQRLINLVDSLRIQAGQKLQVNGNSNSSYAPTFGGWGYDGAITNGANFSQVITVTKQILTKGNLENQYEAIRLLNESLTLSGKISVQDLFKSVTAQYITAYGDLQQVNFTAEQTTLLRKEEQLLKTMTEKGVYRQTDYLAFLVTIQQQELQVSQAKLQFQTDLATLNYLAGINDTSYQTLEAPAMDIALLPEAESTVFYKQYVIDSMKLRNTDASIDFSYKPRINAFADGGYVTAFPTDFYKNFGTSFGLNIVVPIYDGKQRKMQHDKISISERTRQNYRDYFKTQYTQQVAQLSQQLRNTQQLIDQMNNQLKYSEALIEANRKLLLTGDARISDYILAIGNYMSARNSIRQNTINRLQIINQINYWNAK